MTHSKHLSIPTLSILQHSLEILKDKEALDKLPLSAPIRVLELVRKNTQIPEDLRTIDAQYQAEVEEVILQMKALNWTAPIFDWHQPGKKYISGLNDLALVAYIQEKITQDEFHLLMSLYNAKRQFKNGEPIILTGKVESEGDPNIKEVTITVPTDQGKVTVEPVFDPKNTKTTESMAFFLRKKEAIVKMGKASDKKINIYEVIPSDITEINSLPKHLQVILKIESSHAYIGSGYPVDRRHLESNIKFNPNFYINQFHSEHYLCICAHPKQRTEESDTRLLIEYTSYPIANILHNVGIGSVVKPLIRIGIYSPKKGAFYTQHDYHGISFADPRIKLNPIAPHRIEGGPVMTEAHDAYVHAALASKYPPELKDVLLNKVAPIIMDMIQESKRDSKISDEDLGNLNKFYELTVDFVLYFGLAFPTIGNSELDQHLNDAASKSGLDEKYLTEIKHRLQKEMRNSTG